MTSSTPGPETRPMPTDGTEGPDRTETAVITAEERVQPKHEPPRRFRVSTISLGVVLMVVALCATVAVATDVNVDVGVVAIALMIGLGLLLLVGGSRRSD